MKNLKEEVNVGDIISFGAFSWRVLTVDNGRAMIISENVIEQRAYHDKDADIRWEYSSLRRYLNNEFCVEAFDNEERAMISVTSCEDVDTKKALAAERQIEDGIMTPIPPEIFVTEDKVFLLSLNELNALLPSEAERTASFRGTAVGWWLRSQGLYHGNTVTILPEGGIRLSGIKSDTAIGGVRPALCVNLQS
jgi:hypothetical protein